LPAVLRLVDLPSGETIEIPYGTGDLYVLVSRDCARGAGVTLKPDLLRLKAVIRKRGGVILVTASTVRLGRGSMRIVPARGGPAKVYRIFVYRGHVVRLLSPSAAPS
jgi:hypothetical protein